MMLEAAICIGKAFPPAEDFWGLPTDERLYLFINNKLLYLKIRPKI